MSQLHVHQPPDLRAPGATASDWDHIMVQHGTAAQHDAFLDTWIQHMIAYQEKVNQYAATRHMYYLSPQVVSHYHHILRVGTRLHKQFAIVMFHYCLKNTQKQLPPHVLFFFREMQPYIERWLRGTNPFSGDLFDLTVGSSDEGLSDLHSTEFSRRMLDDFYRDCMGVFYKTHHNSSLAQSPGQDHIVGSSSTPTRIDASE